MNSNFHSLIPVQGVSLVSGVGGIGKVSNQNNLFYWVQGLCVLCYLVSKLQNNVVQRLCTEN